MVIPTACQAHIALKTRKVAILKNADYSQKRIVFWIWRQLGRNPKHQK